MDIERDTHGIRDHHGEASATGLTLAESGYRLTGLAVPTSIGEQGELAFTLEGQDGQPVTAFELSHEKELHLIVVRTDGAAFRHVHPKRDAYGRWSIPWAWEQAGSYRLYTEFVPTVTGKNLTLSTFAHVAGTFDPQTVDQPTTSDQTTGGYTVTVDGLLHPGKASTLTMTVSRDGRPVPALEPYLGALGHLVALRYGDLAYLHVHPQAQGARLSDSSGPQMTFQATAPTPGRYLLYLDFKIAGDVHSAEFVLDAEKTTGSSPRSGDDGENRGRHEHG